MVSRLFIRVLFRFFILLVYRFWIRLFSGLCDPVLDLGEFLFTDAFFNGFILDRVAESGGENIEDSSAGGKADHAETAQSTSKQDHKLSQNRDMADHDTDQISVRHFIHVF